MSKRSTGQGVRQAASSGGARAPQVTAGPSRSSGGRRTDGPSRQQAGRASAKGKAQAGPDDGGDDPDDDDEGDDDADENPDEDPAPSFSTRRTSAIWEAFCIYSDGLLTPSEFSALRQNNDGRGNTMTDRE